jgi:hypothetical protein
MGLTIVSKDNDFRQLSFLHGPPPKVVWLSVGNAGTNEIGDLLERSRERIADFLENPEEGLLVIELDASPFSPLEKGTGDGASEGQADRVLRRPESKTK